MDDGIMALNGAAPPPPVTSPTATFRIGGEDLKFPLFTLYYLEVCKDELTTLGPGLDWVGYPGLILDILAKLREPENIAARKSFRLELAKACSMDEMRGLGRSMDELLALSGFTMPGEAEAVGESPGTGTSMPSPQNSQLEEFAPETSIGSNDPIP